MVMFNAIMLNVSMMIVMAPSTRPIFVISTVDYHELLHCLAHSILVLPA